MMICRWYAELLLLVVTVVKVLAQTVEYQNLGTGIQTEVEENTQEPGVTSSSGLSDDAKFGLQLGLGIGIPAVLGVLGLCFAYKRLIIDRERLNREREEAEQKRKERQQNSGLNREREEAEQKRKERQQNSAIAEDKDMAGIQETVVDEPDNSPVSAQEASTTTPLLAIADNKDMAGIQETVVDEPDNSPVSAQEASTTTPLLDDDITDIDIITIVRIFSLAQLDNVYTRLEIPRKDIDNILQQDNVPQLKAKKVLFSWLDTNKTTKKTRKMLTDAIGQVPECTRSLARLQRKWGGETDQQAVSEADIQDIVDKFSLTDLEDVYIYLGLEVDHIKDVKQAVYSPRTTIEAKEILTQWSKKRKNATRGMVIDAIGKCKDCTAGLNKLKEKWSQSLSVFPNSGLYGEVL